MNYYVLIRGPMASGKTTVAEKVARTIGAEYIAIDRILDEHVQDEWEDGVMSQKNFIEANGFAAEIATGLLESGKPVVFDGNFYWRLQIEDLIERLAYPHYVFTLKASLEVCIERDRKRKKAYGMDAVKEVYRKSTEFDYGIGIDAAKPVDVMVAEIVFNLPGRPARPRSPGHGPKRAGPSQSGL